MDAPLPTEPNEIQVQVSDGLQQPGDMTGNCQFYSLHMIMVI